jgi:hypothetical protein
MIYKSYNFVESYSNADGSKKNSIVLNELGKVIRTQPSAVISALKDAGIKVPRRASRRDLTRLIVANKRNRKLSENLAILIVANSTAPNGVLPNGREKFDNLIDPSGNDKVPTLSGSAGLQGLAQGTQTLQGTEQSGGFFKNIGDFFRGRQEAKANKPKTLPDGTPAPSGWQRFQSWFTKNRGTIGQVAQTTYDSLQQSGKIPTGGGFGNTPPPPPTPQATWFERNKNVAIIGIVAILGGVVYFATKGGGKKGK